MEEKKIMWVVLSISVFVLVVFGAALFLYSPSKFQSPNASQEFAYIKEISDVSSNSQKVDPDLWSRQGDTVPGFQASDEENNEKKSITVIDGSDVEDGKKYIDVSPLNSEKTERLGNGKKLPAEVARELGADVKTEKKVEEVVEKKGKSSKNFNEEINPPSKNRDYAGQKEEKTSLTSGKKNDRNGYQKTVENKQVTQPKKPSPQQKTAPSKPSIETVYWVQTASLSSKLNAEKARDKLAERHMKVQIFTRDQSTGPTHRVRVGPFSNMTEAQYWLDSIKNIQGFEQSYISEEKVRV